MPVQYHVQIDVLCRCCGGTVLYFTCITKACGFALFWRIFLNNDILVFCVQDPVISNLSVKRSYLVFVSFLVCYLAFPGGIIS